MIHEMLSSIRRRLWFASMIRGATFGLLLGLGGALVFAIVRIAAFPTMAWLWTPAIALTGVLAGVLFGATRRRSAESAARLVDARCGLKDGSITALQFLSESEADDLRKIQIDTTEQQLAQIDPVSCVPLEASSTHLRWAGALSSMTVLALLIGTWSAPTVEATTVLPLAQDQANELRETVLDDLEELADEQHDPEIEQLIEELEEKIQELDSETLDEADLLATLSEMEQSLAEARDALQLDMTDSLLKSLAEAIKPSDVMKEAAQAIDSEKYDAAGEQLASMDPSKMGDKQRRAVADNLKKMVAKLKPGQQGELSNTISQLAEGLESKKQGQCKKCLSKLASACKKQGQCKKIGQCMSCQLNRLAQCKSQCRGQCEGDKVARTNSPSQKAGRGASGNPFGDDATKLNSVRNEQQLDGIQGEGPSETELLEAPEGNQRVARQFAAKYNKFQREAEAVLNSEPLPMGHRETVRTYFEAIRPDSESLIETPSE